MKKINHFRCIEYFVLNLLFTLMCTSHTLLCDIQVFNTFYINVPSQFKHQRELYEESILYNLESDFKFVY
jgi:hypothetical protein